MDYICQAISFLAEYNCVCSCTLDFCFSRILISPNTILLFFKSQEVIPNQMAVSECVCVGGGGDGGRGRGRFSKGYVTLTSIEENDKTPTKNWR